MQNGDIVHYTPSQPKDQPIAGIVQKTFAGEVVDLLILDPDMGLAHALQVPFHPDPNVPGTWTHKL